MTSPPPPSYQIIGFDYARENTTDTAIYTVWQRVGVEWVVVDHDASLEQLRNRWPMLDEVAWAFSP